MLPAERLTTPGKAVSPELRQKIVDDAKELIWQDWTIAQIAGKWGISPSTLDKWLAALEGDEYKQLRDRWIDSKVMESYQEMENARNSANPHIDIAIAKVKGDFIKWYAERRDRKRYGEDKAPLTHIAPVLNIIVVGDENTPAQTIALPAPADLPPVVATVHKLTRD